MHSAARASRITRWLILFSMAIPAGALRAAPDDFADAEALLDLPEYAKREEGVARLRTLGGARAERALLRVVGDPEWGISILAARALGEVGGADSMEPLARVAVEGEIQWVRDAAMGALRTLDAEGAATRLLMAARAAQESEVKVRCIDAAGIAGGAAVMKGARDFLVNRDPDIFAAAVRALGRVAAAPENRKESLAILEKVLGLRDDRKQFVGYVAAVEALGGIDDDASRALLVGEILQAPDDDGLVPERIARALAGMGKDAVVAALRDGFAKARSADQARRLARVVARLRMGGLGGPLQELLENKDERVRSEAVRALGLAGEPAARTALEKAFGDRSPWVRREVVSALARVLEPKEFRSFSGRVTADPEQEIRLQYVVELVDGDDPKAIPVLDALAADKAWRVSSAALAGIGTLGVASDLPLVEPRLQDKDWRVRGAAYEALGRLRAKDAIPLLAKGLADRDPVVRGVCLAHLQIMTREKHGPDAKAWNAWWTANGPEFHPVKRSRRTVEEKKKDEENRPRYAHEIRKYGVEILQKARILVVKGAWDHVEVVLDHLNIPNTPKRAQELKDAGLNPNQIVLVNCEGNVDKDSAERLQWFVNVGGYLMSTDWALTKAVQVCFPGYVKQFAGANTGNDVVVVEEGLPGHPFTQGVFTDVPAMMWWLEIQAFPIAVQYPERCEVIVDSREMRRRYGSSPMAITFRWGLGKVQHSLSHFQLQEEGMTKASKPRDRMIFAADNLGLSLPQIRKLASEGRFTGQLNEETMKQIAPDYSMFRMIVNVVAEKSRWVEDL